MILLVDNFILNFPVADTIGFGIPIHWITVRKIQV